MLPGARRPRVLHERRPASLRLACLRAARTGRPAGRLRRREHARHRRRPEHGDLARALAGAASGTRRGSRSPRRAAATSRSSGRTTRPTRSTAISGASRRRARAPGRSSRSSTRRRRRPTGRRRGTTTSAPTRCAIVTRAPTGQQTFRRGGGNVTVNAGAIIQIVELAVTVRVDDASQRGRRLHRLSTDPRQPRFIGKVLQRDDPADENAAVWLDLAEWDTSDEDAPIALASRRCAGTSATSRNGHDGALISPDDLRGAEADPGRRRGQGDRARGARRDRRHRDRRAPGRQRPTTT